MTPLHLIDGHQLLYRAWFGFPARITSRDKTRDLTGVFGFLALARKAQLTHGVGHELHVVFDGQNATAARAETAPDYKSNRAAADHTPIKSLRLVKAALDHAGVRWIELDDHEGDDVLATLASTASAAGRRVVCHSGDRDFVQLLADSNIGLLTPGRGIITAADVTRRWAVLPRQWPDYRALTGDPADNIPGVRGIGPKTAAALLADGLTLDDLPGSSRLQHRRCRSLTDHWSQLLSWRRLIRLDHAVPVPAGQLSGDATPPLPPAAKLLDHLGLW